MNTPVVKPGWRHSQKNGIAGGPPPHREHTTDTGNPEHTHAYAHASALSTFGPRSAALFFPRLLLAATRWLDHVGNGWPLCWESPSSASCPSSFVWWPMLYLVFALGFITRQTSPGSMQIWSGKWSFLITTVCVLNGALRVSRSKSMNAWRKRSQVAVFRFPLMATWSNSFNSLAILAMLAGVWPLLTKAVTPSPSSGRDLYWSLGSRLEEQGTPSSNMGGMQIQRLCGRVSNGACTQPWVHSACYNEGYEILYDL